MTTKTCIDCQKEYQTTGGRQTRCTTCQDAKKKADVVIKRHMDAESLRIKREAVGQRVSNGDGRPTPVVEFPGQLLLRRQK